MVGNPIRMTARAEVPRRPHFGAAVGVHLLLEGFAPEIPDHTLDMHTTKGKAMGLWLRSLPQRWREADPAADPYEDEAYRLWALKQQSTGR